MPVNPRETEVLGEPAYPTLLDIPRDVTIDVVDVFRRAEETPEVARDAVAIGAKVLWLQEGIVNEEAYRIAERRASRSSWGCASGTPANDWRERTHDEPGSTSSPRCSSTTRATS